MKYNSDYPIPGVTATVALLRKNFEDDSVDVLLVQRKETDVAFPGHWGFPGGFLNAGTESVLDAAKRETFEETQVRPDIDTEQYVLFCIDDAIGKDPRYVQVINHCYYAWVVGDPVVVPSDDAADAKWMDIKNIGLDFKFPFNHRFIYEELVKKLDELDHQGDFFHGW